MWTQQIKETKYFLLDLWISSAFYVALNSELKTKVQDIKLDAPKLSRLKENQFIWCKEQKVIKISNKLKVLFAKYSEEINGELAHLAHIHDSIWLGIDT